MITNFKLVLFFLLYLVPHLIYTKGLFARKKITPSSGTSCRRAVMCYLYDPSGAVCV